MLSKKHYKEIATQLGELEITDHTESVIRMLCSLFKTDNSRFDESRFREYIRRVRNKEDIKGLR